MITYAEWNPVLPTGEAVQSWKSLAVDEPLLVWLTDGGHSAQLIPLGIPLTADVADSEVRLVIRSRRWQVLHLEMIHLLSGRNVSRHSTRGLVKSESRRLGHLRSDCSHQYPGRRRNKVIHTYHTQHDVPYPVRRLSNHSSAQDR